MAYSLKNHEDRILKLESHMGAMNKIRELSFSSTIDLSSLGSGTHLIFITCTFNHYSLGDRQTSFVIPWVFGTTSSKKDYCGGTSWAYILSAEIKDNKMIMTVPSSSIKSGTCSALTIYYIVRYNIYNKILSLIKFQAMSEIFTKIFKNGGEDTGMAVSLKNIDDRLTVLENKVSKNGIELIWSGNHLWSAGVLKLGDISAYSLLIVIGGHDSTWEDYIPVPVDGKSVNITMGDYIGRTVHTVNTKTGDISYTGSYYGSDHGTNAFHRVYGLAKVILYYFSNIIKSKILHSNISAINNLLVKFISSSPKIFSKGGIEFGY